jgi:hypothetical protein
MTTTLRDKLEFLRAYIDTSTTFGDSKKIREMLDEYIKERDQALIRDLEIRKDAISGMGSSLDFRKKHIKTGLDMAISLIQESGE